MEEKNNYHDEFFMYFLKEYVNIGLDDKSEEFRNGFNTCMSIIGETLKSIKE